MIDTNEKKGIPQDNESSEGKPKKSIEEILRERKELERMLVSEYTRDVTLMFTDIKGSTSFFERRGDIEGRSMIQEHNDILFPIIKDHNGTIVKTIGDAIMASFPMPEDGVRSGIQIQRVLYERNKNQNKEDQIKVRIGLNYGKGIVQDNDVFGDVVNVAARVESLADAEQILVSKPIYDEVRRTEDILCRYFDSIEVKGKAEPLEIYRVVWGEEEMAVDRTRSAEPALQIQPRVVKKLFELEITRENDKVKVSGYEKFEGMPGRTVIHYEDAQFSPGEIEKHCREITSLLNQANKKGKVSKDILIKLQKLGQLLYNGLLTAKAREQLNTTEAEGLIVNIDDQLVQIPWELLYDGKQFFCQRFNMGRLVKTRQVVGRVRIRRVERPLKMLILSDPQKNLPSSHQEGFKLTAEVEKEEDLVTANHRTGTVRLDDVRKNLCHYDVIHYAGHADYDPSDPSQSGWLLSDGKFTSHEITCVDRIRPMPALVFSNACHSGQTEEWKIDQKFEDRIYGLANGFLLSGVQHYIGTFWEIQDEPGSFFALEFYRNLFKGNSIGEALRLARQSLIRKYGEENIVWASYMLYGDPTHRYFDRAAEPVVEKRKRLTAEEEVISRPFPFQKTFPKAVIGTVVGALILMGLFLGWYFGISPDQTSFTRDPVEKAYAHLKAGKIGEAEKEFTLLSQTSGPESMRGYEGMATVCFQKGHYQQAQELCEKVLHNDPQNVYAHVIMGNIYFNQGAQDEATKAYESASQAEHGSPWQKAEAYNRLGRIYAEQKKNEAALSFFNQAINLNPENSEARSNKGVLLANLGKTDEAISAYREVLKKNPKDTLTTLFLNQLLAEKKAAADKERQERIDRLIADLADRYKKQKAEGKAPVVADTWTSRPLTITLLNFESKGTIPVRSGENEFLAYKLIQSLQGKERISVIERELIDKLLEELNLSSSALTDPATALSLGKIIGARFITTGSVLRMGTEVQVTLRMIETETSTVTGAFTETSPQEVNLSAIADSLAVQAAKKLIEVFPLRGKLASVEGENVTLNIGAQEGVKVGMTMAVFQEGAPIVMEGREIGKKKIQIGDIEIITVEEKMSTGRIISKKGAFAKGQKVMEILEKKTESPQTEV